MSISNALGTLVGEIVLKSGLVDAANGFLDVISPLEEEKPSDGPNWLEAAAKVAMEFLKSKDSPPPCAAPTGCEVPPIDMNDPAWKAYAEALNDSFQLTVIAGLDGSHSVGKDFLVMSTVRGEACSRRVADLAALGTLLETLGATLRDEGVDAVRALLVDQK